MVNALDFSGFPARPTNGRRRAPPVPDAHRHRSGETPMAEMILVALIPVALVALFCWAIFNYTSERP
jgi:hypothetical protein